MTGTICVQTSHSLSRSYLNHLVRPSNSYMQIVQMFNYLMDVLNWFDDRYILAETCPVFKMDLVVYSLYLLCFTLYVSFTQCTEKR